MIIAIDGPAASGKGTLGKRLAHHYGYRHLDTGVIYRAVAWALMEAGAHPRDELLAGAPALLVGSGKIGKPPPKTPKGGETPPGVVAVPQGGGGPGHFSGLSPDAFPSPGGPGRRLLCGQCIAGAPPRSIAAPRSR